MALINNGKVITLWEDDLLWLLSAFRHRRNSPLSPFPKTQWETFITARCESFISSLNCSSAQVFGYFSYPPSKKLTIPNEPFVTSFCSLLIWYVFVAYLQGRRIFRRMVKKSRKKFSINASTNLCTLLLLYSEYVPFKRRNSASPLSLCVTSSISLNEIQIRIKSGKIFSQNETPAVEKQFNSKLVLLKSNLRANLAFYS